MSKPADRNSSDHMYERKREDKSDDIGSMIKKNLSDEQAFATLRSKTNDSKLAEKMFDEFRERKKIVETKALKFKNLIFQKYSTLGLPKLLEKAKKFKKKYELSDDEFHAFINLALNDKNIAPVNMLNQANTPMAKLLGFKEETHTKMNVPTNELEILQQILTMFEESRILHEQIKTQSLTYIDCAPQALMGDYDRRKFSSFSYIHPVVAALFLPRIKYIDEHLLLASLSNIVYHRYHNLPIKTLPDHEVLWDLKTDPNEIVCVSPTDSPLIDLRNRVKLQIELWKQVFHLREGRYYSDEFRSFNVALDSCKNNLFNDAEFSLVRDEGTVLRKIFGIVGLRPTIVSIASLNTTGIMSGNYSLSPMATAQVTSIPIINLRLPITFRNANLTVTLESSLEQYNWFVENKTLVPKVSTIIHSRDIIVFYANRRYQSINFGKLNAPYNFHSLPATTSAFESLNDVLVNYDETMYIDDSSFNLRSVVFVEKSFINESLITGCSTGIILKRDYNQGRLQPIYLNYDPQSSIFTFEDVDGSYVNNPPIVEIPGNTKFNRNPSVPESFRSKASRRGTTFIYVKNTSQETVIKNF